MLGRESQLPNAVASCAEFLWAFGFAPVTLRLWLYEGSKWFSETDW